MVLVWIFFVCAMFTASAQADRFIPVGLSNVNNQVMNSTDYAYAVRFVLPHDTRVYRFFGGFNLEGVTKDENGNPFIIGPRTTYAAGTGGIIRARLVRTTLTGEPDLSVPIAQETVPIVQRYRETREAYGISGGTQLLHFNMGSVLLQAHIPYAIVYDNVDIDPENNWFSENSPVVKESEAGPNGVNTLDPQAPGAIAGLDPREAIAWSHSKGSAWEWGRLAGGPGGYTPGSYAGSTTTDDGTRLPWYGWQATPESKPLSNQPYFAYAQQGAYTLRVTSPKATTFTKAGGYAPVGKDAGIITVTNVQTGATGSTASLGSGIVTGALDTPVDIQAGQTYEISNTGYVYKAESDEFIQDVFAVGSGDWPYETLQHPTDRAELFALPHPLYHSGISPDIVAPSSFINHKPPSGTSTHAFFSFTSDDPYATLECQLDGTAWTPCDERRRYHDLTLGAHTFSVRATDPVGNVEATPVLYSWTIHPPSLYQQEVMNDRPHSYWRLGDTDPERTYDVGSYQGLTASMPSTGVIASDTDGSRDFAGGYKVEVPAVAALSPTSALTLEAWVRYTGSVTGEHAIISRYSSTEKSYLLQVTASSGGRPVVYLSGVGVVADTDPLPIDQWVHVVATYDGSMVRMYRNGVQTKEKALTGTIATSTQPLLFGTQVASYGRWNGLLDEVALYPHALSATDIARHYQIGLNQLDVVEPNTTITAGPSGTSTSSSTSFSFTSDEPGTFQCRLDGSVWSSCLSPRSYDQLTEGVHVFEVRAQDAVGNWDTTPALREWTVDTNASVYKNEVVEDQPLAYWRLGEKTGTTLVDVMSTFSGTYRNGALLDQGGALHETNSAALFDGVNDKADVPYTPAFDMKYISIEAWVKFTGSVTGDHAIVSRYASTGKSYLLQVTERSGGRAVGYLEGVGVLQDSAALPLQQWVHLVLTYDGSTMRMYRNGVQQSAKSAVGAIASSTTPINLGMQAGAYAPWNGLLDEIALYPRALSAMDITRHYQIGLDQLDIVEPNTTITAGPSGTSTSSSASFSFTSDEPGTFQCRLDGSVWTSCSSPRSYDQLTEGIHVFEVRAQDTVGNWDTTPTRREWTVDTNASVYKNEVVEDQPLAYWRLGEKTGTTLVDTTGTFPGIYRNGALLDQGGALQETNSAALFDGVNDKADVAYSSELNMSRISIEAWVKFTGSVTGDHAIVSRYASTGKSYLLQVTERSGGRAVGYLEGVGVLQDSAALPLQQWVHLILTYDGSTMRMYRNGVQTSQRSISGIIASSTTPINIGMQAGTYAPWNGLLDEIALYPRALSPMDITRHYQIGLDQLDIIAPETTITAGPSGTSTSSSTSFSFTSDEPGTFQCRLDGSVWSSCLSPQSYDQLTEGIHVFEVRAQDTVGNWDATPAQREWTVDTNASAYKNGILEDQPLAYWRLAEKTGTTLIDVMGTFSGTYRNGALLNQGGALQETNSAALFDGVNDKADVPYASTLNVSRISIEAWVKFTGSVTGDHAIVSRYASTGKSYLLQVTARSGGRAVVYLEGIGVVQDTAPLPLQQWVHLVATYDGSYVRIYRNGSLTATKALSGSLVSSSTPINIGMQTGTYAPWSGLLDEVALYPHALTATQISKHYSLR